MDKVIADFIKLIYPEMTELAMSTKSERECLIDAMEMIKTQAERIEVLEELLRDYGSHLKGCNAEYDPTRECECGFNREMGKALKGVNDMAEHGYGWCQSCGALVYNSPKCHKCGGNVKSFCVDKEYVRLRDENKEQAERIEELEVALTRIYDWAKSYPIKVFPEPDFKEVAKVLKAVGISLDAVSASNMRHVINGVKDIIEKTLNLQKPPNHPKSL